MTKDRSVEEPCAGNLASTVLKTSGESDLLAEFDRALRPAVIARKVSPCSQNQTGARIFEAFKSVTQTFHQTGRSVIDGHYDLFRAAKLQPQLL